MFPLLQNCFLTYSFQVSYIGKHLLCVDCVVGTLVRFGGYRYYYTVGTSHFSV
jgi:hypothetical protein